MIKRIFFLIYSLYITYYLKLFYKNNFKIKGFIVCNGFINIELSRSSQLIINGNLHVRSNAMIAVRPDSTLTIGEEVFLNRNSSIVCRESITIGNNTLFGEEVKVYDNNHKIVNGVVEANVFETSPIFIGNNCWIANSSNILKGSVIPDKTVIGAMSLVNKKLSEPGVYIGIPCKLLRKT